MLPPSRQHKGQIEAVPEDPLPMAIVVEDEKDSSTTIQRPKRKKIERGAYRSAPRSEQDSSGEKNKRRSRGISVHNPGKIYLGALITIAFITSGFVCVLMPFYLLTINQFDLLALVLPGVFVVMSILFLTISSRCTCRVCRTSLFTLKGFTRNRKAHHITFLGYNISTALHIVLFRWFRCQACGTSQQFAGKE